MYKTAAVVLHTSMNNLKIKFKKQIPFAIELKRIKHLGINLTKVVDSLYDENYKTR